MKVAPSVWLLFCFSFEFVESLRVKTSYCPTPVLKNGKYRYRQRAKFVKYTCNVGYILYGDRYNNCHHGKWDGPPPKCVRSGCKKVSTPMNGLIYPSHMGSVLHFYCKSGFEIHGPNVTYCDGTNWSSNKPICLVSKTKPSLNCDFEQADLCGWTHDLNHDFEWRRQQFSTPSGAIGTGPSHDHTLGVGKAGFYMYVESSSRNENDVARFVSPVYEKTDENTCFVFYYHMYGSTIGTLRVYLRMINETWKFESSKAFFELKGNQGDKWFRSVYLFENIPNDYQIIIEGVRGNGYVSDIAIDDVAIVKNCSLSEFEDQELSTTTEIEEYSTTDFLPDDFYSCENRCYSTDIQIGNHRKCACDENCYDRNECCPDYIDFCLLQGTSDEPTETTYTISSSPPPTTPEYTSTTPKATEEQTIRTTRVILTTPHLTTKREEGTTKKAKTPTTTQQFLIETTKVTLKETTTNETPKQTTREETESEETITEDQNSEPIWITPDLSNEIPNYLNDFAEIEDVAHLKRNSKQKIVIQKLEEKSSFSYSYVLICVAVVVAGFVLVVVRKRRDRGSRRFRSGSLGGSASDVRFLTSDELLDLNLNYE